MASHIDKIKVGDIRVPFVTAQKMTAGVPVRVIRLHSWECLGQQYCDYLVLPDGANEPVWVSNLKTLSRPHDGK